MPACRGVTAEDQLSLARTARLLLVFLLQSLVVLLAGFAALLVDFEPGWSAEDPPAALLRPSDRFNVIRLDDTTECCFQRPSRRMINISAAPCIGNRPPERRI